MADAANSLTTTNDDGNAGGEGKLLLLAQLKSRLDPQTLRKLGLVAGLVASVAVGVLLFLWAQEPEYRPLYSKLSEQDAAAVVEALQAAGVAYKLDDTGGTIRVPAKDLARVRLQMASQGLPKGTGAAGFEALQKEQGFGTSQFMENARFQRALETELARSIATLHGVESARVHLAVPKQSVFIRERNVPTASVVVTLASGRGLTEGQVAAIVHMVASSVPELTHENVTVVDQRGRLLTRKEDSTMADATAAQLEYRQALEEAYVRRIENLLAPVVGAGRVRAQVSARVNFAHEESTQELYDPNGTALRSEQLNEERTREDDMARGVPGALTNQPPQAGTLAPGQTSPDQLYREPVVTKESSSATRNFEVTKTVRHTKAPVGTIERLSVAVLVDQKTVVDADGNVTREPLSQVELDQITALVREAVGFDPRRGDSISVMNAAFQGDGLDGPRVPWYEQPQAWEVGKLALATLVALVLVLKVIAPIVRTLLGGDKPAQKEEQPAQQEEQTEQPLLEGGEETPQLAAPEQEPLPVEQQPQLLGLTSSSYEEALMMARQVVNQDPTVAANVVKSWLSEDE